MNSSIFGPNGQQQLQSSGSQNKFSVNDEPIVVQRDDGSFITVSGAQMISVSRTDTLFYINRG